MNNIKRYNARRKRARISRQKATARPYKVIVYNTNDPTQASVERFTNEHDALAYVEIINNGDSNTRAYLV